MKALRALGLSPLRSSLFSTSAQSMHELALQKQTPIKVKELISENLSIPEYAKFLHKELPIRLARRVIELENLPYNLSVKSIHKLYKRSFTDLLNFPFPETPSLVSEYTSLLKVILNNHNNVVPVIAHGILELKKSMQSETEIIDDSPFLQDFLDRFFMARINIRTLISHLTALCEPKEGFSGIFEKHCKVSHCIEDAIEDASIICDNVYARCPSVTIKGKKELELTYIPGHIYHIGFELLKNSMRATCEHCSEEQELPGIDVVLAEGDDNITMKISDRGGGIERKDMNRIFTYAYTTVRKVPELGNVSVGGVSAVPMAGYGYGLPLTRLYAQEFGGDLVIVSIDGYGTDAYLYLNKLKDSTEIIPY